MLVDSAERLRDVRKASDSIDSVSSSKIDSSLPLQDAKRFWDDFFNTDESTCRMEEKSISKWNGLGVPQEEKNRELLESACFFNVSDSDVQAAIVPYKERLSNLILDGICTQFADNRWRELTIEEKHTNLVKLGELLSENLGIKEMPTICFYNTPDAGDCGGYDGIKNVILINDYTLNDPKEAVDTICHEMWHAHQRECVFDSTSERGKLYAFNLLNYIRPTDNFALYESQLVEMEAREFASNMAELIVGADGGVNDG